MTADIAARLATSDEVLEKLQDRTEHAWALPDDVPWDVVMDAVVPVLVPRLDVVLYSATKGVVRDAIGPLARSSQ